jgi:hypothetical protein
MLIPNCNRYERQAQIEPAFTGSDASARRTFLFWPQESDSPLHGERLKLSLP